MMLAYDHRYFERTAVSLPLLARLLDERDSLSERVAEWAPDLVCFSVLTNAYQWSLDMAARMKRLTNAPVLFGGVHVVSVPEVVIGENCVDMVCVGEGEGPLLELLEQLENYPRVEVPGIWVKGDGAVRKGEPPALVSDLDSLPLPDKDLFYYQLPWLSAGYLVITSRGCPYACTFCGNDVLRRAYRGRGRYVRRRSVEGVLDEMLNARSRYNPERFNILDDCFTADKAWLEEFCRRYRREVRLPFVALSHPRLIDGEVAGLLSGAGCFQLLLGLQSSSERTRREVLNRRETNLQIQKAAELCHIHNLSFSIDHIFCIPGEGVEEYRHALGFYNSLRPSAVNTYWLIYFPRTRIVDTALEAGILSREDLPLVDRGLLNVSMNVGIGRGESGDRGVPYTNYAFLYALIPLLPPRLVDFLVRRGIYLEGRSVPLALIAAARVLALLKIGIWGIYRSEVLSMLRGFLAKSLKILFRRAAGAIKRFHPCVGRTPEQSP